MTSHSPSKQTGFSLIELVTVLLIITVLSTIAIRSTVDIGYSVRYEQTRDRLESIRKAIVGDPKRSINGQPDISGFVADMGRLPDTVRELTQSFACINISTSTVLLDTPNNCVDANEVENYLDTPCSDNLQTNQTDCEALVAPNNTWVGRKIDISGITFGWNGPYLNISDNPSNSDAYTDGWGRETSDNNYGWKLTFLLGGLTIESLGKDGINDSLVCGENEYDGDCDISILKEDFIVNIDSGISLTLRTEYDSHPLCGFSSSGTYALQPECENAGGLWGGPCSFNVTNCKTVGGLWQSCFLSSSDCTQAGGTRSTICKFTQNSCTALTGASWTPPNCSITSNVTDCNNAGGTWSGTECLFDKQQCSNAGGVSITQCEFDNTACTAISGTWETTLYNSCTLTQANCNAIQGHSLGSDCYMSHAENTGAVYSGGSCAAQSEGDWINKICAIVFYRDPNTSLITSTASNPVIINESGVNQTFLFDFTTPPDIPIGINSIAVYEYDGNCTTSNSLYPLDRTQPNQVIFKAHASLPSINW